MSTYDYNKVMSDYSNDRMTVEMATGHSLQHIGKLYEAQTASNTAHYALQSKVDGLEKRIHSLQAVADRLTAFMEQVLATRKQNGPGQPTPG